jgi:subtilisin family serine protease
MTQRVIVELAPTESLAAASFAASSRLTGHARLSADRRSLAAGVLADADIPALGALRLDPTFPPVPVPEPEVRRPARGEVAARTGARAFDVRRKVQVSLDPLTTPYIVRGEIDGGEAGVEALRRATGVSNVYADPLIAPSAVVCPGGPAVGTDRDVARLLGVERLAAAGMDGRGVLLAIVDSGINLAHLRARGLNPTVDRARSWEPAGVDGDPFEFPVDHGTMCAYDALIAAPRATLLDIAVLLSQRPNESGSAVSGLLSDAIAAYSHLLGILRGRPQRPGGALSLVVSNSWAIFSPQWDLPPNDPGNYTDNPEHLFNRSVTTLEAYGADILFAAGNCGAECADGRCEWPAGESTIAGANGHPAVLSVAGVDVTGERVGYSSTGPGRLSDRKPDISGFTHFYGSGVYGADGGTSAACPVVAGLVAAVRSRLPSSQAGSGSPAAVRDMVRKTALERGNPGFDYAYGWGIVNGPRLSEVVSGGAPGASATDPSAAVLRLEAELSGKLRGAFAGQAKLAANTGKKTEVIAHLVTGEDIESALITSIDNPDGADFKGSPRDQKATVFTDEKGRLVWGLDLETQTPFAAWTLTLTKKGEKEGEPDGSGTTDQVGHDDASDVKNF